jgi:hypothetical protein
MMETGCRDSTLNTILCSRGRRILLLFFAFFIIFTLSRGTLVAQPQSRHSPEKIKAWHLITLPKHIKWPAQSGMQDISKPFIIKMMGESPVGKELQDLIKRKKVKRKKVQFQYISKVEEIPGCHLLFIPESKRRDVVDIINFTRDKPIFMVSEIDGYAKRGIHVTLTPESGKIRVDANETTARRSGLMMTASMLKYKAIKQVEPFNAPMEYARALEQLTREAQWPAPVMGPNKPYFNIVILGNNPFGTNLSRTFRRKRIVGKRVNIRFLTNLNTVGSPHLLFISASMRDQLPAIISQFKDKPVLLAGAASNFANQGVHVNFYIDVKVRMEINTSALLSSGLTLNRGYIGQARIVRNR